MRSKRKGFVLITILFIFSFNTIALGSIATPSNAEYKAEEDILTVDDRIIDNNNEFRAAYSVEIPKSIYMQKNIDNNCFEAKYELKVSNLNITDERSCLVIEPDESFRLTANNKEDITVYVEQEEIEFSNLIQDDLSELHITIGYLYTEEPLSSASWKGSFSFNLSLIDLGETIYEERTATVSNAEQESEVVDEYITTDIENSVIEEGIVLDEESEEENIKPSIEGSLDINTESSENTEESSIIESSESTEENSNTEPSESTEESSNIEPSESTEESSNVEPSESVEESSNVEPSENTEESSITEPSESIEEPKHLEESNSSSMEELVC